jgi:hypothetical protein
MGTASLDMMSVPESLEHLDEDGGLRVKVPHPFDGGLGLNREELLADRGVLARKAESAA